MGILPVKIVVASAVVAVTLLVLDGLWLWLMGPTYRRLLGDAMLETFRLGPAAAFYLLYIVGVTVLIVLPALSANESIAATAGRAALFGLVAYGTYALTNFATLKVYGSELATMDLVWGPILTAIASLAAVTAARQLGG